MSKRQSPARRSTDQLAMLRETLCGIGAQALHLQARAALQERPAPGPRGEDGAIARAADEARTDLRSMSRYCRQYLTPRARMLMAQAESLAESVCGTGKGDAPDLPARLGAVAGGLNRWRAINRGQGRAAPRGAGMLRLSEQRLWGALAVELHRIEGADGPIARACSRIEGTELDLAGAIGDLLETGTEAPLPLRYDLGLALVGIAADAAAGQVRVTDIPARLGPLGRQTPAIVALAGELVAEYAALGTTAPQVAAALSIATQAGAQSAVTARLEQGMQELDQRLAELAADYQALAKLALCGSGKDVVRQRLRADAPLWQAMAEAVAQPLALAGEAPVPSSEPGSDPGPGLAGGTVRAGEWHRAAPIQTRA